MQRKLSFLYKVIISAFFTFVFYCATQTVYSLPFSYGDDHRIMAMLHPEKVDTCYKAALYGFTPDLQGCFGIDAQIGRFRPLSWTYNKILCLLFGDKVFLFRASNLVILFLSVFFLFGIFSCFGVDIFSSLVVIAIYVFGRNNESWWTLIPPHQNIGELFLLAGIYVWLKNRTRGISSLYLGPAVLFLISALCKESFIFCIPVLLLSDYFFLNPVKKVKAKEYWLSFAASLFPFLCLLLTVVKSGRIYAYPHEDSGISIAFYNAYQFVSSSIFFLAPLLLLFLRKDLFSKNSAMKFFLITVLWGGLQLILLNGIKMDGQHHYLIPWLILPLILTAIALTEIRKFSRFWFFSLLIIYCAFTTLFIKNTWVNSSAYSASLKAYHEMIEAIKKDESTSEIVYLTDNAVLQDWINGTRVIMDNAGIDKELSFCTTAGSIPPWQQNYATHSPQHAFRHIPLDSAFYPNGKWIILVENPARNGFINDQLGFYKRNDSSVIRLNGKEKYLNGRYIYFSSAYAEGSLRSLLNGTFNKAKQIGFYAVKLNKY
jgi:hypothetical protein